MVIKLTSVQGQSQYSLDNHGEVIHLRATLSNTSANSNIKSSDSSSNSSPSYSSSSTGSSSLADVSSNSKSSDSGSLSSISLTSFSHPISHSTKHKISCSATCGLDSPVITKIMIGLGLGAIFGLIAYGFKDRDLCYFPKTETDGAYLDKCPIPASSDADTAISSFTNYVTSFFSSEGASVPAKVINAFRVNDLFALAFAGCASVSAIIACSNLILRSKMDGTGSLSYKKSEKP